MKGDRISSWSKILSFADYEKYPIYDSRTAVAVNIAAERTRCKTFLYIPKPRKGRLTNAVKRINRITTRRQVWTLTKWNYLAYLFLLRQLVRFGLAKSILDAETTLFSNSDYMAYKWVNEKQANSAKRQWLSGRPHRVATTKRPSTAIKRRSSRRMSSSYAHILQE